MRLGDYAKKISRVGTVRHRELYRKKVIMAIKFYEQILGYRYWKFSHYLKDTLGQLIT